MSLSFNGTTSVLSSDSTQTIGDTFSGWAWIKASTQGENNKGIIMSSGGANEQDCRLLFWWNASAASKKLQIRSSWSGNDMIEDMTTGFSSITDWLGVGFSYDGSSSSNHGIIYTLVGSTFSVLTSGSGLTAVSTPTGALVADNQTFRFGNAAPATETWDGLIGEAAFWKRIITAEEFAGIAINGVNVAPDHFNYLHMEAGSAQNLGSSGVTFTASNTTTGENPPIKPVGRRG